MRGTTRLTCSLGVSTSKVVAKIASDTRKPGGITVVRSGREPAFLELAPPVMVTKQCRLELDNGSGVTMRVELVGYDAADLEALSRSFGDAP